MIVDGAKVAILVQEEARRLKLSWMAIEPLISVIKNQWRMHRHWDFFYVDSRRLRLLEEPRLISTECLNRCLEIIKKDPNAYLIPEMVEGSNEDTSRVSDPPGQVQTEAVPIKDPPSD